MATLVCSQRAQGAEPAHLQPGPMGPRRPSLAQRPEPRPLQAARALGAPSPRAPRKYPMPRVWLSSEISAEQRGARIPQTRAPARGSPAQPGGAQTSPSGEVGGGLRPGSPPSPPEPAGRLEAASPGWGRGRAAPRGRRARLGCKLSGRREGGRRGAPVLARRPSQWAPPVAGPSRPVRSFSFG